METLSGESTECRVGKCGRAQVGRKPYCDGHWRRYRKGLPVDVTIPTRRPKIYSDPGATCSVDACDEPVACQGMCRAHYARLNRGMEIEATVRSRPGTPRPECSVPTCDREADAALAGAVCAIHRGRLLKRGDVYTSIAPRAGLCFIPECGRSIMARKMCARHQQRAGNYSLSCVQLAMTLAAPECAICGDSLTEDSMHIDHDHACCDGFTSCGYCIRGTLCRGCNHGLGNFLDDPRALISAAAYLAG